MSDHPQPPRCDICPHACRLADGETGLCSARAGRGGTVVPLAYGLVTSLALDPVEKKPLAHWHPGSRILSVGSLGCNLDCPFCQNSSIARLRLDEAANLPFLGPEQLAEKAVALKPQGNVGVAFTYNEPLINLEYVLDCAQAVHAQGLQTALVTNGYTTAATAERAFADIDAANIDLKAFDQGFYDQLSAPAGLAAAKRSIQIAMAAGTHVEVTTLVIPGLNDSPEAMAAEAAWLASLSPDIPLHVSAFHPAHRMLDRPRTPRQTILELVAVAQQHLAHVHPGNI